MQKILEQIKNTFYNLSGESSKNVKEYILSLNKSIDDFEKWFTDSNLWNYIFYEINLLFNKGLLNLLATNILLKKWFYSWWFITSYYSSFFIAQAINRLVWDFYVQMNEKWYIKITYENWVYNIKSKKWWKPHEKEFNLFYEKISKLSSDGLWYNNDNTKRNNWNYYLNKNSFFEFDEDLKDCYYFIDKYSLDNSQFIKKSINRLKISLNIFKEINFDNLDNKDYVKMYNLSLERFKILYELLLFIWYNNSEYKNLFNYKINKINKSNFSSEFTFNIKQILINDYRFINIYEKIITEDEEVDIIS